MFLTVLSVTNPSILLLRRTSQTRSTHQPAPGSSWWTRSSQAWTVSCQEASEPHRAHHQPGAPLHPGAAEGATGTHRDFGGLGLLDQQHQVSLLCHGEGTLAVWHWRHSYEKVGGGDWQSDTDGTAVKRLGGDWQSDTDGTTVKRLGGDWQSDTDGTAMKHLGGRLAVWHWWHSCEKVGGTLAVWHWWRSYEKVEGRLAVWRWWHSYEKVGGETGCLTLMARLLKRLGGDWLSDTDGTAIEKVGGRLAVWHWWHGYWKGWGETGCLQLMARLLKRWGWGWGENTSSFKIDQLVCSGC